MKILQVNVVYNNGSTGKIVYDIHHELVNEGVSSIVCYGRGTSVKEKGIYKICSEFYSKINHFISKVRGVLYGGCFFSTNRLISIIKKEKPNIVHLHCLNGYFVNIYKLINWLKKHHVKTILTLHAEFMYTGGCGHSIDCNQWSTHNGCGHSRCPRLRSGIETYFFDKTGSMWKKMRKSFDNFNEDLLVVSVSPWLKARAEISPILTNKNHIVILNGIDTKVFHLYKESLRLKIKKELGIKEEKVVFHVTANFNNEPEHIKGGYYLIELAKRLPDVRFVVAGLARDGLTLPTNVMLLGRIDNQVKLAQLYSMADLTVMTSKKETFSMVVAESLCCGTPIVGFEAGAPEQIAISEYSKFVAYGNIDELEKYVSKYLNILFNKIDIEQASCKIYSRETMFQQYKKAYKDML